MSYRKPKRRVAIRQDEHSKRNSGGFVINGCPAEASDPSSGGFGSAPRVSRTERDRTLETPYGWKSSKYIIEAEEALEATVDKSSEYALRPVSLRPIATQAKDLVTQEIPFISLCVLLILLSDFKRLERTQLPWLNIWGVLFEASSAFGTCGLTLSTAPTSLSGFLSTFGKLVVMVMMISGRHRNAPYTMDPQMDIPNTGPKPKRDSQEPEDSERGFS